MSPVSDPMSRLFCGIKGFFGRLFGAGDADAGAPAPPAPPPVPPPPPPLTGAELAELRALLVSSRGFGGWWFGVAAAPLPELLAFRRLLADASSAAESGRHLLEHGGTAGVAYGLCLLWLVDQPTFRAELPKFRDRSDPICLRWGGCMPGGEQVLLSKIIASPEAFKLTGPEDSVDAWMARNPGKQYCADIEGGGYPLQLAGR